MEPWSHAQIVKVAEEVPGEVRVIGLIASPGDRRRTVEWAAALGAAMGRRRSHCLLVNLDDAPGGLDEWLAGRTGAGFSQAIRGKVPLARIASTQPAWGFVFLAAGENPAAPNRVLRSPAWSQFVRQVTAKRGTVLAYLGLQAANPRLWSAAFEGLILLEMRENHSLDEIGVPVLGRIGAGGEKVTPEAIAAAVHKEPALMVAPSSEVERVRTSVSQWYSGAPAHSHDDLHQARRRKSSGHWSRPNSVRPAWIVGSVAVAVLLIVTGWSTWSHLASRTREFPPVVGRTTSPAALVDSFATPVATVAPPTHNPASPELPYSVLIASYGSWQDAIQRVQELEAEDETVYFVAPTPVRGSLYYRVFGGAQADGASTVQLMERLVHAGQKDRVSSWDMRPVRFAFDLGERETSVAARATRDSLRGQGVPAYVVPITRDRESRFRLYSGAFESPGASVALAAILRKAIGRRDLVERRGETR